MAPVRFDETSLRSRQPSLNWIITRALEDDRFSSSVRVERGSCQRKWVGARVGAEKRRRWRSLFIPSWWEISALTKRDAANHSVVPLWTEIKETLSILSSSRSFSIDGLLSLSRVTNITMIDIPPLSLSLSRIVAFEMMDRRFSIKSRKSCSCLISWLSRTIFNHLDQISNGTAKTWCNGKSLLVEGQRTVDLDNSFATSWSRPSN